MLIASMLSVPQPALRKLLQVFADHSLSLSLSLISDLPVPFGEREISPKGKDGLGLSDKTVCRKSGVFRPGVLTG